MTATKAILIIFTFAVFFSHSVYGAPEVSVSEGIVSGSEPFTNLSITLSEAPNGLSGYNITISLSNASIAEIISVDFPDWALLNKVILLPAESAWIKAVDLQNNIIKGANNVILANFTVRGKSVGIARVLLTVRLMDDDDGHPLLEAGVTPSPTPGGNGGSSGSSGGTLSDEDFKNIEKQESRIVDIHSGHVVYKFTTQDIIREIGFDAKTSGGLITAKIEYLIGRPKKATFDAPGSVFKYFNVVVGTSGYGSSSKLENAFIVFDVPDEWLRDNNLDSVKAMKFKDSSWINLKTEKISPGTYKASSSGFSSFVIVGTTAASMEKINPSSTTSQANVANTILKRENKFYINLSLLLLVVIVLIVVAFAYFKRKELSRRK